MTIRGRSGRSEGRDVSPRHPLDETCLERRGSQETPARAKIGEQKRDPAYLSGDTNDMFARLLLLIAIFTGLMAGPSALGAACTTNVTGQSCECCLPAVITCCETPSTPVQRTPVSSENGSQGQLKLAIQPLVALLPARLCVRPPVVEMAAREIGEAPVSPLIDRICILLI